ncbi:FAD:protein FMN transferase [Aliigemmobacter aestuarii]|uniref:FAD:protein FMN transferase n=1 Tax=Aliigemmobacter aestuarii TaxID=1445661 RepID=A0A4S3MKA2_9RHOB|nr:FAD:protein FMN transferase [Gemmobacter aestuarii]THD82344.1 FAD:protein FMN transferase [Gemmobacter aestuarii]
MTDRTLSTRRRFLAISAAAAMAPSAALPGDASRVWTGRGLGGALSVRLDGVTPGRMQRLAARIEATVDRVERQFSLYRDSDLTRLNRDGRLSHPSDDVLSLFDLADRVHRATGGAFDPTVQPVWAALARSGDVAGARRLVGWDRVRFDPDEIRLEPGMALTFNGIAQGWAADRVADALRAEGLENILIDMGEILGLGTASTGAPWRASILSPHGASVGQARLHDLALATSSPLGTTIAGGAGHILHPLGLAAVWSTVSVSAPQAAVADALSTACCLLPEDGIDRAMQAFPGARCEVAVA